MLAAEAEAALVRTFWARLGLPGLVDVHTHFMPDRVLKKVWAYFDSAGPLTGVEWPIAYREEEARRIELLADFGVTAFTSMLYPHKADMARWLNGWAVDFARRTPGCLHTATFFPEEGAGAYVEEALDGGARVFKAHVQVGVTTPTTPSSTPCGARSPRPPCPSSSTAAPGPRPASTPGPSPSGASSPGTPGCG